VYVAMFSGQYEAEIIVRSLGEGVAGFIP